MSQPVTLSEASDERVAVFRDLPRRHAGAESPVLVESELAVARVLTTGLDVYALLATPQCYARLAPAIRPSTAVYLADSALLRQIVGFELHRGCIAHTARPTGDLASLRGALRPNGNIVVICEGVSDPKNLGAVVRNARAFGASAVVVDPKGADPFERRAVRASMAHCFTMPVLVASPPLALDALRSALGSNLVVLAATVGTGAMALPAAPRPAHVALLLGNEGVGLTAELTARADLEVTIPICADADSINVAAASAVLLYALSSASGPVPERGAT